jgi:NADH-quinone oxidoreductase subunit E
MTGKSVLLDNNVYYLDATRDYADLFSGFKGKESDLIPILQRVQEQKGYLSEEAIRAISGFLKISESQIYGVASFYSQFRFIAPGRHSIKICVGTACHVKGGYILCEATARALGVPLGQTTADGRYDFQQVACLGCCALAPVIQIDKDIHSRMTVISLQRILEKYE